MKHLSALLEVKLTCRHGFWGDSWGQSSVVDGLLDLSLASD